MKFSNIDLPAREQNEARRKVWDEKPTLRYYLNEMVLRRIRMEMAKGPSLEIGAGSGWTRESVPNLISSDISFLPWNDLVCSCLDLPFRNESFANVLGIEVFHHMANPDRFLHEAGRVLRPGGMLLLLEPWITPVSYLFFRFVHYEHCNKTVDPWKNPFGKARDPFEGNTFLPYQCFAKNVSHFRQDHPSMELMHIRKFDIFAYPLVGGFQRFGIKSMALLRTFHALERALEPVLAPLFAMKAIVVIRKLPGGAG